MRCAQKGLCGQTMYKQGDELKLCSRPEWGIGRVTKVEHVTREGARDQRIWVRFPNVGMKTILAGAAEIERMNHTDEDDEDHTLVARENAHEGGWLGEITKKRPEEAMIALPPETADPFTPLRTRFKLLADLYRFQPEGASLIDWAIAQSGLDDPLSRFNRHELEEFFRRWAFDRDQLARQMFFEARHEGADLDDIVNAANGHLAKSLREKIGR